MRTISAPTIARYRHQGAFLALLCRGQDGAGLLGTVRRPGVYSLHVGRDPNQCLYADAPVLMEKSGTLVLVRRSGFEIAPARETSRSKRIALCETEIVAPPEAGAKKYIETY